MGTIAAILRSLQVKRPGFASVIQKQSVTHRSGGFPNDDRPVKVKRAKSVGKKMVTAQWYTTVALPQVLQKLLEKRPRVELSGILLHHDNASAHATHLTMDFVRGTPMQLLSHPPYNPDLAPG